MVTDTKGEERGGWISEGRDAGGGIDYVMLNGKITSWAKSVAIT